MTLLSVRCAAVKPRSAAIQAKSASPSLVRTDAGGLVAERQQLMGADRVVAVCCPGRRHGVLEQPRSLRRDIPEPGVLVGLEDGVHLPGELIQGGRFALVLAAGPAGRTAGCNP